MRLCITWLAITIALTASGCAPRTSGPSSPPIPATNNKGKETTVGGRHGFLPDAGFVSDAATAIRIAEAVWIPIYGEEQIGKEKPYRAVLKNGVWTVTGSLPHASRPGYVVLGGVAEAEISKKDGRIIRVSHGK